MDEQLKQQILQQIGPDVIRSAVQRVMAEIQDQDVQAEDLIPVVRALEQTLEDPDSYPMVVAELVRSGLIEPDAMPPEFEPTIVVMMIIVFNEVIKALQQQTTAMPANFARGGLTTVARELQKLGRGGDTMLAHINPQEAAMLKAMGGSGTINPHTGLREFLSLKKVVKSVTKAVTGVVKSVVNTVTDVVKSLGPAAPIIAAVIAPYAIPALAGSLGVGSLAAGALYGAGTSALMGGDPLRGAVMGALGGGLGDVVGGAANQFIGTGLSAGQQALLGNTLVGGALGAATGQGFGKGAIGAATGTMLGNAVGNLAGTAGGTALGQGLTQAGKTIGQMTTAGMPLKQAIIGGALSGLTAGALAANRSPLDKIGEVSSDIDSQIERINKLLADPSVPDSAKQAYSDYLNRLVGSKEAVANYQQTLAEGNKGTQAYNQVADSLAKPGTGAYSGTQAIYQDLGIDSPPPSAAIGATNVGMNLPTAMVATSVALPFALESLTKAQTPQEIQQMVQSSNPEYFNDLRLNSWDWNDISNKAASAGMPLGLYVAQNWNNLTNSVRYTSPGGLPSTTGSEVEPGTPVMARGGALSKVAYLARGSGSGRDDTIDARLSDGEYVIDAETVAMLGDGSTKAGAAKLDAFRRSVRQHKGRALAKGKFSPNAKSPLAYLKGAM